jgi:ABC-type transport system involved in multi-copper enzyme maturation permease subunit
MAGDMPNAGHQYVVARESRNQFESFQDRFSDFCSSILVKETRQAIKSRQFFLTFMVLIVLGALRTFYALSPGRDNYSVDSLGAYTLHGFLYVLGLPLCLIIPFTTFRSLAQEYEDGTIQMILITTMRPYQIVAGKLGSAMLQVLVYLAVLGPCISFCYLLRGVDVTQILMSISLAVVTSFGLCCAAIGLAGGAKTRRTGQGLSLLLIMALAIVSFWWCMLAYGICFEPAGVLMEGFSVIAFGPLAGWLSTALLLFVAAAAQISFPSSNRSTMIRVVLLIQTVLFLAWYIAICSMTGFHEQGFMVASCFAMQYWLLVGAMMVGCHSGLSPRVRRTLPSGFLKRSVVSLFMPGPGRAYLFTVGAAFSVAVCLAVLALGNDLFQRDFESSETFGSRNTFSATDCRRALGGIFANWIYFLLFFSVLFLFSRLVARGRMFREPFFLLMAIIAVAMVFLVTVGSYTIDPYVFNSSSGGFEPSQLFNWYRIQALAADRGAETVAGELSIITVLAVPLFLVCFWIAARDLLAEKAFVPQRVLEEDEEKRKQNLAREYDDETIDEIFAAVRPGQSPDTL